MNQCTLIENEPFFFFFPNVKLISVGIFKVLIPLIFFFRISAFSGNRSTHGLKVPELLTASLELSGICFHLPSPIKTF